MADLTKPTKTTHAYYDYHACRDYLQARDGYDERDYAGKFTVGTIMAGTTERIPYHDFWNFVCEKAPEIRRDGTFFTMCDWWGEGATPWQQEILQKYLDAFGDTDPHTGGRCVEFYVAW